ncbi:unnamed protein product [Cercopithifilaria johnstoni]|uniref:ATPase AAA-type core domain-containing protein n=1 Tax=Cercopithifilaria johnstoni TaxID=2874296 RepID=A0A8J2MDA4_9BILA|nr:unnamed protein product [Cercopithifilaria johnstoni]
MATDDETISQSQIHSFDVTTSVVDKNMNDSLEKAAFGRKHLRRRSSLFFRNTEVNDIIPEDISKFDCHSNNNEKTPEEKAITSESKRRTSMHLRKSVYRTRSKAAIRNYMITCEPPPVSLKPILLSAAQKTARRITMRAKGWNKHKRVHFHSVLNIHDITPRSGKIPGVVKMPDSPPIVKESAISKIAGESMEHCIPITQPAILQDATTNTFRNEAVRFLPVMSKTFQCHPEMEKIEECQKTRDDKSNSEPVDVTDICLSPLFFGVFFKDDHASQPKQKEVDNCKDDHASQPEHKEVDNCMNTKKAVDQSEVSNMSEVSAATKRTKRHVEETAVMWVRGDRLRSLSIGTKEDLNENKENTNLNVANGKESDDVQWCNNACTGLEPLSSSLLAVPRAGPKAKVKKWLQDIPNYWNPLLDGEDTLILEQQEEITESTVQSDNVLMDKQSSRRRSFGGLPKKQEKGNKCRRRSLLLQEATSLNDLPTSNRRQTIIVGEMKENLYEKNTDEMNDDVILLNDQELNSTSRKSLTFCKKMRVRNRWTMCKSETATNISPICNAQLTDTKTNCIPAKHEKTPVLMDEMDFAPFPSISNVGYAEIAPVHYDLPCGLRGHQVPKMVSDNNNIFQMSLWRKSFDEDRSLKQKVAVADSRILLRPKRKKSKHGRWKLLTEELKQNTWSEALRPVETDELIIDGSTVRKLCDWINIWKGRLQKSRNHKKDIRVTSHYKRRDSDSFDSFGSDEEGEQLCNTAIIYGHCGSGKTSLVYAVSKRYEMHVLEIASNEKRNGLQLKCKLQGATHSHKFSMSTMVNQVYFQNEKNKGEMVEDSIILVDDCDVIYDKHDDGFWPALRTLCKVAHIPVIIVCEDISFVRRQLGFEAPVLIFSLIRPEIQTVSSYLQELCAALNISVCPDLCCALAEQYNGDLRACINQLQFYSGEDSNNSLGMLMERLKSREQIEFETLPKKCYPIPYNVILRYDHSYEPGAVLSSTDREEEDLHSVEKNDTHIAVKVTRSALPAIEYFPLSDVILDYIPYLCIMNRASRAKMPASRRAQHYFDELHDDSQIDSSGTLKNALTQYCLLTY